MSGSKSGPGAPIPRSGSNASGEWDFAGIVAFPEAAFEFVHLVDLGTREAPERIGIAQHFLDDLVRDLQVVTLLEEIHLQEPVG